MHGFFPPEVALVRADDAMYDAPLLDEEGGLLTPKTVDKRRRELQAGRAAARAAMRQLNLAPSPILAGPHRAPIWPAGVVGSISHCPNCCMAAVGSTDNFQAIGLDVEQVAPLKPDLWRMILTERERARIASVSVGMDPAKLTFSAKEAFYKAYFPMAQAEVEAQGVAPRDVLRHVFLDFLDVELTFGDGEFTAVIIAPNKPSIAGKHQLSGRFRFDDDHVYTAVWVQTKPPEAGAK